MKDFIKSWIIRIKKYLLEVFFRKVDLYQILLTQKKFIKNLQKIKKCIIIWLAVEVSEC